MLNTTPTLELLSHAIDVSALRQSVYAANIANAGVDGYRRMEVSFDSELERVSAQMADASGFASKTSLADATVIPTNSVVKLDEEMALMAKNALRYQVLLGAFERSMGALRAAIREGRE
jgi:flagellar basal-body rod protein FlgB